MVLLPQQVHPKAALGVEVTTALRNLNSLIEMLDGSAMFAHSEQASSQYIMEFAEGSRRQTSPTH